MGAPTSSSDWTVYFTYTYICSWWPQIMGHNKLRHHTCHVLQVQVSMRMQVTWSFHSQLTCMTWSSDALCLPPQWWTCQLTVILAFFQCRRWIFFRRVGSVKNILEQERSGRSAGSTSAMAQVMSSLWVG
jgi:hypothetical protein